MPVFINPNKACLFEDSFFLGEQFAPLLLHISRRTNSFTIPPIK